MGFKEAIRTCLREKYVTFSGRAPRSEYWWFQLFYWLLFIGLGLLFFFVIGSAFEGLFDGIDIFGMIVIAVLLVAILALILPSTSVLVRRFHDRNLSGWWVLASFIVPGIFSAMGTEIPGMIITLVVFVITILKGTEGPNKYGPDPLNPASDADVFT